MDITDKQLLNAVLRNDFMSFVRRSFMSLQPGTRFEVNWHHRVMAHELIRCLNGETRRLIVTLPPRNLKSTMASVAFPAFALGHDPTLNIVCASYSADLAGKFSRDCRYLMQRDWYRAMFSDLLDAGKLTEFEITTLAKGGRLATSVNGTLTGRGGNFIILDDPLNAGEASSPVKRQAVIEWYTNTLLSRLDNKAEDVIIVVAQRLHDDDLVGHLLRSGEHWVHINLPAIAEEAQWFELDSGVIVGRDAGEVLHETLEPMNVLMDIKANMTNATFAAQYQQNPVPLSGDMITWSWFKSYSAPLERQDDDYITISWDTASKSTELSDYSVATVWLMRNKDHFLLDIFRKRLDYPDLKKKVVALANRYEADAVLIEDKASGTSLIQDLQEDGEVRPIAITPEADKATRMFTRTDIISAGYIWLPDAATWLDDFKREILQFPRGKHDDQVDSFSQYLNWDHPMHPETWEYRVEPSGMALETGYEPGTIDYDDMTPGRKIRKR